MIWIVARPVPGKPTPRGAILFGNIPSEWQPVRLPGERGVLAGAAIPADHPDAARVVETMRARRDRMVVSEVEPVHPGGPSPVVVPADSEAISDSERLGRMALLRGWTAEDMAGSGAAGDPGVGGGRAVITGLTLAELTLTVPPADWAGLRERQRPPWESPRWVPPVAGWQPPAWAEKSAPPTDDVPRSTSGEDDGVAGESLADGPPPTLADSVRESQGKPDPESVSSSGRAEPNGSTYPVEAGKLVRPLVLDYAKQTGGKVPSPGKINFLVRKLNEARAAQTPPAPPVPNVTKQDIASFFA